MGARVCGASGTGTDDHGLYARRQTLHLSYYDELRIHLAIREQRLRKTGYGAEYSARNSHGPRAVRLFVQDVLRALEIQASDSGGSIPYDGRCFGSRSRLVLERLVL